MAPGLRNEGQSLLTALWLGKKKECELKNEAAPLAQGSEGMGNGVQLSMKCTSQAFLALHCSGMLGAAGTSLPTSGLFSC